MSSVSHQLTGCCACNTRRWRRTFLTWQLVVTGVHWWALTRTLAQPKSQFQQTDIRWHQSPVHVLFSFRPILIYFVTLSHLCLDLCNLCNPFILLLRSAVLLLAEPGDLILWDSRTIHGGPCWHQRCWGKRRVGANVCDCVYGTKEPSDNRSYSLRNDTLIQATTP